MVLGDSTTLESLTPSVNAPLEGFLLGPSTNLTSSYATLPTPSSSIPQNYETAQTLNHTRLVWKAKLKVMS
jgi:hypothetical protein